MIIFYKNDKINKEMVFESPNEILNYDDWNSLLRCSPYNYNSNLFSLINFIFLNGVISVRENWHAIVG